MKKYQAPKVIVLGNVLELTLGWGMYGKKDMTNWYY